MAPERQTILDFTGAKNYAEAGFTQAANKLLQKRYS